MPGIESMAGASRASKPKITKGKKIPLGSSRSSGQSINSSRGADDDIPVEQRYQKKTQLEHILLRPDTYIGSIEKVTQEMWVYDAVADCMVKRMITFVPGLYKIFDEIIVNAADNKQRDDNMGKLKVNIDEENGKISVWNDGKGIPIQMHREHGVYVPELIFGHLLTGSNFDDGQKKTTGGRNGYGAKLANIYSTEFVVETADSRTGKHYRQTFRNNMLEKGDPQIQDYDGPDFTCITFCPDWARFHMTGMESDTMALLRKRVYDVAGCVGGYGGGRVKVYLDKNRLQVSSFKEYIGMYQGMEDLVVFDKIGDRWEVGIAASADQVFQQVSFVNAICTTKGGNHVNYVADQVVNRLLPLIKKKNKAEVKGPFVKNHLCVYVNGLVENPSFNSQSKEALTTKDSSFGSLPKLSDASFKAIEKSEIVERVLSWAKHKQNQQLNKKSGKKSSKLTGITKLDDANKAGTSSSQDCTLILTEGDSAKTLAVSGLGVVGRDRYGVFPLKGKLLNVREATSQQVLKNEEIQNMVKIMGLKFNHKYEDTKSLRYGHLMIMTDQDHDGSHIKGLLINFIHHYWPSLLKIHGFLQEFITPIVKVNKGIREMPFYTVPEYEAWKETHDNGKGWTAKYYKGLGTSTAKEAKEYFAALDVHQLEFEWKDDNKDSDLIDMAFSKRRVEDRKDWLRSFKPGTHADYTVETVTYDSFVNKELILFSLEDNKRSIPCLVDGFKPSQRKVLFSCFKRNLKKEIKVVQLAGYVSEHSAYHHGENSLNATIIGMAQNFVGSNNIGLLNPGGQFGTRLMGGKDHASPRYIFSRLEKTARAIFHPDDDPLLNYLDDDGLSIEPEYYIPVLPLILVNGSEGIGTGWSSSVPNYAPRDVIENLRRKIRGQDMVELQPWYDGFAGEIQAKVGKKGVDGGFTTRGIIKRTADDTVEIQELPVRKWTQDYKQFLEGLLPGGDDVKAGGKKGKEMKPTMGKFIKDFKENHTDTTVHFTVTMSPSDIDSLESEQDGLVKFFKLESTVNTSNMVLFDRYGQLVKYDSPQHIMEDFYDLRMDYYGRRKVNLLSRMQREWSKLDNKVRFILAVVEGRLVVSNRRKADLLSELQEEGYDTFFPERTSAGTQVAGGSDGQDTDDEGGDDTGKASGDNHLSTLSKGYDYLLSMKLWSLTLEKVRQLEEELGAKTIEMERLKATSEAGMWLQDLDKLSDVLDEIAEDRAKQLLEEEKQRKNAAKRGGKGRRGKKGGVGVYDGDSDFEDGPKKKTSKASKAKENLFHGPPPPLPTRVEAPALAISAEGGKVSAAFALAESLGMTVRAANARLHKGTGNQSRRSSSGSDSGDAGSDFEMHDTATVPVSKDMSGMSLAERVRQKFRNMDLGAGPAVNKVNKEKAAPSSRKPSAIAESDSDVEEVPQVNKVAPKTKSFPKSKPKASRSKPKAAKSLYQDSDSEEDDLFDGDDSDIGGDPWVPVKRPPRRLASSKPAIVESPCSEETEGEFGTDEEGGQEKIGDQDAFCSDGEGEDDYLPSPPKNKSVRNTNAKAPVGKPEEGGGSSNADVQLKSADLQNMAQSPLMAKPKPSRSKPKAVKAFYQESDSEEDGLFDSDNSGTGDNQEIFAVNSDEDEQDAVPPSVPAPVHTLGSGGARGTKGSGRGVKEIGNGSKAESLLFKTEVTGDEEEDDVFAMNHSDMEGVPLAPVTKAKGKAKADPKPKAAPKAQVAPKPRKAAPKAKAAPKSKAAPTAKKAALKSSAAGGSAAGGSKGVKRGKKAIGMNEDEGEGLEMFSPERLSPPTKRVSQKATPAADRFKLAPSTAQYDSSDESRDGDSAVQVVKKTPRPTRRAARTATVNYVMGSAENESEASSVGDMGDDSDEEFEF